MDRETRIQRALRDLRAGFEESLRSLERDAATDATHISEKIEKRKELARSIDLSGRILSIYENVKYYPSWSQHCPDYVCSSISNVAPFEQSEKSLYGEKVSLDFEFKGKGWSFAFRGNRVILPDGADGGYYGGVSLLDCAKNLLFEGRYERGEYSSSYKPLDIDAFVPGEWVVEFLELSEEIAATRREADLKHKRAELQEQRQRFGLDKNDSDVEKLSRHVKQYTEESQPEVSTSNAIERRQGLIASLSAKYSLWSKNRRGTK
jgi:hypothetical protein